MAIIANSVYITTVTTFLREMSRDDLELIVVIESKAHTHPWTRGHFESNLQSSHQCWVMEKENTIVAYAVTSTAADEAELLNITVAPAFQRQGLGKQLLTQLCQSFTDSIQSFFLEFRASNHAAIALYQHYGFNEVGVRTNYYPSHHSQREDAIIMALSLNGSYY